VDFRYVFDKNQIVIFAHLYRSALFRSREYLIIENHLGLCTQYW